VGWAFSVEILERVGLHGSCFAVQNGCSGHVVPQLAPEPLAHFAPE